MLEVSWKLNFPRIIMSIGWKIRLLEVKFGLNLIINEVPWKLKFPKIIVNIG